jgi:hypothetical protein
MVRQAIACSARFTMVGSMTCFLLRALSGFIKNFKAKRTNNNRFVFREIKVKWFSFGKFLWLWFLSFFLFH